MRLEVSPQHTPAAPSQGDVPAIGCHDQGPRVGEPPRTKLEAFAGRGRNDYLASPDFEDIVALLDGRQQIVEDVTTSAAELRGYIREQLSQHLSDSRARDAIGIQLGCGSGGPDRAEAVGLPRIDRIIGDDDSPTTG